MGLPGSGKTTLSRELAYHFNVPHINADVVREAYNNWDFSMEGRAEQAYRMTKFPFGILDFVCPRTFFRNIVNPDIIIYMDTIEKSRYKDTNDIFQPPTSGIRITEWIPHDQLLSSLEGFNPGTAGILSYLNGPFLKLVK